MSQEFSELRVKIVEFIDSYQPGIVRCEFTDADGQTHTVIDKLPIVSSEMLDESSAYPQPGAIRCRISERMQDPEGRDLIRIDINEPDQVASTEGLSEFTVLLSQIRPNFSLGELLAASDFNTRDSRADREWIDAPRVGREII